MLSVNCMLNHEKDSYFYDTLLKPLSSSPSLPPPRSSMLNITSLLCHDEDEDDVPTTPCLSAPSSPIQTNKKLCLSPPFININHRYNPTDPRPFSTIPSSPLTPPLLRQPYSSSVTSFSSFDDMDEDGQSRNLPTIKQQQPSIGYHYHHRLLMMMPQDNEQMQDKTVDLMNNNNNNSDSHRSPHYFGYDDDADDDDEDDEEEEEEEEEDMTQHQNTIKSKRKRATKKQLQVLHRVFERTFFPSTQVRAQLGQQLGMNPRTVQIWFQNRRQALRTKEKQKTQRSL